MLEVFLLAKNHILPTSVLDVHFLSPKKRSPFVTPCVTRVAWDMAFLLQRTYKSTPGSWARTEFSPISYTNFLLERKKYVFPLLIKVTFGESYIPKNIQDGSCHKQSANILVHLWTCCSNAQSTWPHLVGSWNTQKSVQYPNTKAQ